MNDDAIPAQAAARRPRVLVAAGAAPPAPLHGADDPEFTFVRSADEAVEKALACDFDLVVLDLGLAGIGAAAAADILRRSGAPGMIAAVGPASPGTLFDHWLQPPLTVEAVRDLLRAAPPAAGAAPLLDDGWIERECADLAAQFHAGLPAAAASLEALSDAGDIPALAAQVHVLKGCAGTWGRHEIARQCASVEASLRQGRHDVAAVMALASALVATSAR